MGSVGSARAIELVVFWVSVLTTCYVYALYPLLIKAAATLWGSRQLPPADDVDPSTTVTILIVAHDEESVIGEALRRAVAQEYPRHLLDILVASDGSTDRTVEIAVEFAADRVRVLDRPVRCGKAATLSAAMSRVSADVVVLCDANTHLDESAVRRLAARFDDRSVGVVCGRLVLTDPDTGRNVDSMYWRYETFLKRAEAKVGGLVGANGGLYALRRSLFPDLHASTIVDDFVIPLLARLRTGCRIVYEENAIAREQTPSRLRDEFRRRSRIGAGGFQSLSLLRGLLSPVQGWTAFAFFSHKVLRWLCPMCLIAAGITNVLLADTPFYVTALGLQTLLYVLALAGRFLPGNSTACRALRLTTMFAAMNAALLVGFALWISGQQRAAWQRTAR